MLQGLVTVDPKWQPWEQRGRHTRQAPGRARGHKSWSTLCRGQGDNWAPGGPRWVHCSSQCESTPPSSLHAACTYHFCSPQNSLEGRPLNTCRQSVLPQRAGGRRVATSHPPLARL